MASFRVLRTAILIVACLAIVPLAGAQTQTAQQLRLYVLEGGVLASNPASYQLGEDEVKTTSLAVASYLIVHPDGILIWDTGAIADQERAVETGAVQTIIRADLAERHVTLGPPLAAQLAAAGFDASDVTHLSMSHYHWDHTANSNLFAHASWLVRPADRDAMFSATAGGSARTSTYSMLENSETILVTTDEYDVFGDGKVILKAAPGHTPGHQVLLVDLPQTGPVVLSGDLYHYPEERSLGRMPAFEMQGQTPASREAVETFLSRTGAQLWIQHDLDAHRRLKKAPAFYD
jgi:glyoxylase-like metal-dependent hydrolase (beta-lactamase superfamily II)